VELESRASKTQRKSRHDVAAYQRGSSRLKCICFNAGSVTVRQISLLGKENITAVLREGCTYCTSEGSYSEAIWVELRNRKGVVTIFRVYY